MEPLLPGLHEFAAAVPFTPTADTRAAIDAAIEALRSTDLFAMSREGAQQLLADIDAEVAQRVALACGPTPVPYPPTNLPYIVTVPRDLVETMTGIFAQVLDAFRPNGVLIVPDGMASLGVTGLDDTEVE
jgi:predicted methyltransferase